MASLHIALPWMPRELSPNARGGWKKRARFVSDYRTRCANDAWNAGANPIAGGTVKAITFHPPNKQGRDLDNMIASFKAGQDGLSDTLGRDDQTFRPTYDVGDPIKGGSVLVEIEIPD